MLKLIISLMLAIAVANSAELKPQKVLVNFEAHKTPSNKAVKGQFEDVKFTPATANGNTFREVFLGASFMINSKSAVIQSKEKEKEERIDEVFL